MYFDTRTPHWSLVHGEKVVRVRRYSNDLSMKFLKNCSSFTLFYRIRSDNNSDNSIEIVETWLKNVENSYHTVDSIFDKSSQGFHDEEGISHWSPNRFAHIINLREEALSRAKQMWADYIWVNIKHSFKSCYWIPMWKCL